MLQKEVKVGQKELLMKSRMDILAKLRKNFYSEIKRSEIYLIQKEQNLGKPPYA